MKYWKNNKNKINKFRGVLENDSLNIYDKE